MSVRQERNDGETNNDYFLFYITTELKKRSYIDRGGRRGNYTEKIYMKETKSPEVSYVYRGSRLKRSVGGR